MFVMSLSLGSTDEVGLRSDLDSGYVFEDKYDVKNVER